MNIAKTVTDWVATARHPRPTAVHRNGLPAHARTAGLLARRRFKTFIVSGGGIDFMRPWSEKSMASRLNKSLEAGIKTKFELRNDKAGARGPAGVELH